MPQASEHLRELMISYFGNIEPDGPQRFLKDNGYTLSEDYKWSKPGVRNYGNMERKEFECFMFLMHEYDYGNLAPEPHTTGDE